MGEDKQNRFSPILFSWNEMLNAEERKKLKTHGAFGERGLRLLCVDIIMILGCQFQNILL